MRVRFLLVLVALALLSAACNAQGTGTAADSDVSGAEETSVDVPITVYTGRSLELVGPLLDQFQKETGIALQVRSGDTAELAATILEEGTRSPADVYFAQDAGALGALSGEGLLAELPEALLDRVDPRFRATDGTWVGASGRARTMIYSTDLVAEDEVPDSVFDLTDPRWRGRVGWAPTNGSFQAFVTAMRVQLGDAETREWLEGMVANDVQTFDNNAAQVEAAGRGEIAIGLVNHYYLYQFTTESPDFAAANKFLAGEDPGALVNVAGLAILQTSDQQELALQLVEFLLSEEAQEYFSEETSEYPLVEGVEARDELPALSELDTPELDLADLDDLAGTLQLLQQAGVLN